MFYYYLPIEEEEVNLDDVKDFLKSWIINNQNFDKNPLSVTRVYKIINKRLFATNQKIKEEEICFNTSLNFRYAGEDIFNKKYLLYR